MCAILVVCLALTGVVCMSLHLVYIQHTVRALVDGQTALVLLIHVPQSSGVMDMHTQGAAAGWQQCCAQKQQQQVSLSVSTSALNPLLLACISPLLSFVNVQLPYTCTCLHTHMHPSFNSTHLPHASSLPCFTSKGEDLCFCVPNKIYSSQAYPETAVCLRASTLSCRRVAMPPLHRRLRCCDSALAAAQGKLYLLGGSCHLEVCV